MSAVLAAVVLVAVALVIVTLTVALALEVDAYERIASYTRSIFEPQPPRRAFAPGVRLSPSDLDVIT